MTHREKFLPRRLFVQCVFLLDRADNETSYRAQSKADTTTLGILLSLRDSFSTCAMLSLRGVLCVASNQYNTDASTNHLRAKSMVGESVVGNGTAVAVAVRETGVEKFRAYVQSRAAAGKVLEAVQAEQGRLDPAEEANLKAEGGNIDGGKGEGDAEGSQKASSRPQSRASVESKKSQAGEEVEEKPSLEEVCL